MAGRIIRNGMSSSWRYTSAVLMHSLLTDPLKDATSTLFPAAWTFCIAGTKSLSPDTTIATSKWFIRACSSISQARETSTSFCTSLPSDIFSIDSLEMTLNPSMRSLSCSLIMVSFSVEYFFDASKT